MCRSSMRCAQVPKHTHKGTHWHTHTHSHTDTYSCSLHLAPFGLSICHAISNKCAVLQQQRINPPACPSHHLPSCPWCHTQTQHLPTHSTPCAIYLSGRVALPRTGLIIMGMKYDKRQSGRELLHRTGSKYFIYCHGDGCRVLCGAPKGLEVLWLTADMILWSMVSRDSFRLFFLAKLSTLGSHLIVSQHFQQVKHNEILFFGLFSFGVL